MRGIYKIITLHNNKYYIGSSIDIEKRWRDHLSKMKMQKHANMYLQNVYNKYGESDFAFVVLLEMPNASNVEIRQKEQEFLNKIFQEDKDNIYNLARDANGGNSTLFSKKSLENISQKNRDCSNEDLKQIQDWLEKGISKKEIARRMGKAPSVLSGWIKKYLPKYSVTYLKRQRIKTFLEMKKQGFLNKEIAEFLGVSNSTISTYNKNPKKEYEMKPSNSFNEEQIMQIKKYKEEGYGNVKIAEFMNSNHSTIQRWINWLEELEGDKTWQFLNHSYT